jgi:hypothetical protein
MLAIIIQIRVFFVKRKLAEKSIKIKKRNIMAVEKVNQGDALAEMKEGDFVDRFNGLTSEMTEIQGHAIEQVTRLFNQYTEMLSTDLEDYNPGKEKKKISQLASLREEIIVCSRRLKASFETFSKLPQLAEENRLQLPPNFFDVRDDISAYIAHLQQLSDRFGDDSILLAPRDRDTYKKHIMKQRAFLLPIFLNIEKLFLRQVFTNTLQPARCAFTFLICSFSFICAYYF